jgi:DNA-binding beta-propeller fold protein YncE
MNARLPRCHRRLHGRLLHLSALVGALAALVAVAAPAQAAQFTYVANNSTNDVSQYIAGPTPPDVYEGGELASLSPATVAAGSLPSAVAVSPNGASVYVTNDGSNSVSQYDVGAGGALTPKSPPVVAAGSNPKGVAVSPNGASVYVANTNSNSVSQYDVGAGGTLTPKSPATVAAGGGHGPFGVAVSPNGASVYVVNQANGVVSQYDVGAGGALTPKSPATVAAGWSPREVAVSPNGASVYVTNALDNNVSQYDVGAGGALTPKSTPTVAAGSGPRGVAVSPSGARVYVANYGSSNVSQFDVGAGGALAPKSPATVAAGSGAYDLAVSPNALSVYVANAGSNNVSQFDIGAGGALAPKSPATVAAGVGPIAVAVSSGPAPAYPIPATATEVKGSLVNNFRQTLTSAACTASGRTSGAHAAPFALSSCLPPAFLPGTAAALGADPDPTVGSESTVKLTAVQDNPATPGDEGDIRIESHLRGVICLGAVPGCPGFGAPYLPVPGSAPDVTIRFKMRLNDHLNCAGSGCGAPFTMAGTVSDFNMVVPSDCTAVAPAASCDLITSIDAVAGSPSGYDAAAIAGKSEQNAQIFRIRVGDAGLDSILGNADDKEFAMQGLVVH